MKMLVRLKSQEGLTIVEVLISAVVFVIGFSLLVVLLSNAVSRFSVRELVEADRVGHEVMELATTMADTTLMDTLVIRSGQKYRVERRCGIEDGLVEMIVTVSREGSGKQILELYDVFRVDQQR